MNTKTNGTLKYAGSLLSDHLLALLAAVLMKNFFLFFSETGFPLLTQLLCLVITFLVFYVDSWKRGCSDGSRIRLGRMPNNYFRGFIVGLIAAIPGFILALGAFVAETGMMSFSEVFDNVDIFTTLNRFWNLPFAGFMEDVNKMPILNFAFPLFMVVVSGIGYILGRFEITLKQFFVYKTVKDEDDDEDEE